MRCLLVLSVLAVAACNGDTGLVSRTPGPDVPSPTAATSQTADDPVPVLSAEAAAYLDEALAAMQEHSINRELVDWDRIEDAAFRFADGATVPAETYFSITLALDLLNDEHSRFLTPAEVDEAAGPAVFDVPVVETREDGVGYVWIGVYRGFVGDEADGYAQDLAARVESISSATCGWIVDLRSDHGGNMWAMIAGLAPLLERGVVGSFVYPDGRIEEWEIVEGVALWDGEVMVNHGFDQDQSRLAPTAILIGGSTASAGEAVAVAFHGQDRVRFFGQPTAGLTTAVEPVELSDGAMIALTMSAFADRNGTQYGQGVPVEPDQEEGFGETALGEEPIQQASKWLLSQPECRS